MPPLAPALALLKDLGFINMNHAHVPVSPDSEFDHVVTGAEHSLRQKQLAPKLLPTKCLSPPLIYSPEVEPLQEPQRAMNISKPLVCNTSGYQMGPAGM